MEFIAPTKTPIEKKRPSSALSDVARGALVKARELGPAGIVELLGSTHGHVTSRLEITVFHGGRFDTTNGQRVYLSVPELVRELDETAELIIQKGEGPYLVPGTSTTGRCRDIDLEKLTVLAFDCDGAGDWDTGLHRLQEAGVSFFAQRSARHTVETPKFHLFVPIEPIRPAKSSFRRMYRFMLVIMAYVFGFAVDLTAEPQSLGFDRSTDRLLQPIFCATRRQPGDTVAASAFFVGRNIDLEAVLDRLDFDSVPEVPPLVRSRQQRVAAAASPYAGPLCGPLQLAFHLAGLAGGTTSSGALRVLCPWRDRHTTGHDLDGSTVVFAPSARASRGFFFCVHAHCVDRRQVEALLALPEFAVRAAYAGGTP